MTPDTIRTALGWSSFINLVCLLLWFIIFTLAHDFMYGIHNQWFNLPVETFNTIHYAGLLLYKVLIVFFSLIPYLILRFAKK